MSGENLASAIAELELIERDNVLRERNDLRIKLASVENTKQTLGASLKQLQDDAADNKLKHDAIERMTSLVWQKHKKAFDLQEENDKLSKNVDELNGESEKAKFKLAAIEAYKDVM